jgi:hypothetical protein
MPLLPGKKNIAANIGELFHANVEKTKDKKRPKDQIIAIAESEARKK